MSNPYTPIRRLAQALLAEVQGILAEVTLLELQAAGVRYPPPEESVLETVWRSAQPKQVEGATVVESTPARRGRPRKVLAPPLRPSSLATSCPDPDGEGLLESLAPPAPASSPQGNANGTRLKKIYPWERP